MNPEMESRIHVQSAYLNNNNKNTNHNEQNRGCWWNINKETTPDNEKRKHKGLNTQV